MKKSTNCSSDEKEIITNCSVDEKEMIKKSLPPSKRRLFCFDSLVILDVARCYLWLFTLYINIKIGKIVIKC